jgi:hypothetical protein
MSRRARAAWSTAGSLALILLALAPGLAGAGGRPMPRELKQLQYQMLVSARSAEFNERARRLVQLRRRLARGGRFVQRPARERDEPPNVRQGLSRRPYLQRVVPAPNVLVNDRTQDLAPASGQSEVAIAVRGRELVAAWNDGEGQRTGGNQMGFAWSSDAGATWHDGGTPPNGTTVGLWLSDPVLTVNEKTGEFYLCGIVITSGALNGIAVVKGTFSAGSFAWQPPVLARIGRDTLPDKPWIAADSSSGNVHLVYTAFERVDRRLTDQIEFQRSTDGGATWSAAIRLSGDEEQGLVQGGRPAVGPAGEVHVSWTTIDTTAVGEGRDFIRVRRSLDRGATFEPGASAVRLFSNFGSGAPGFNRGYGFTWPAIAVDRSRGIHRGRVYLAWNESVNFFRDTLGALPERGEQEPNGDPERATLIQLGETVTGRIDPAGDADLFAVDGVVGETAVFFVDSVATDLDLALRAICFDGTTRLAYNEPIRVRPRMVLFTFPESGRYYLRLTPNDAHTGEYRIRTGLHAPGPERARDHRDVFTNWSDDGTTWSEPARVNLERAGYDDWLPEVLVGADGTVYVLWYDWRDTVQGRCGTTSNLYLARSFDGSDWSRQEAITDVPTDWPLLPSNIAPNQGDYLALAADAHAVHPVWADGRLGDPDVFTSRIPVPSRVELVRSDAEARSVRLSWYAPAAGGVEATLYRRQGAEEWGTLVRITSSATGILEHEDATVLSGVSYDYRLGIVEEGAERFVGAASVEVPQAAVAFERVEPNPASRDLFVRFTLPSAAGATLELLDVAGRRVRSIAVGGAAGRRTVNLGAGPALPAGIYLVRLAQRGASVTAKVAIVR